MVVEVEIRWRGAPEAATFEQCPQLPLLGLRDHGVFESTKECVFVCRPEVAGPGGSQ